MRFDSLTSDGQITDWLRRLLDDCFFLQSVAEWKFESINHDRHTNSSEEDEKHEVD